MTIKVIQRFADKENDLVIREEGDVFEVSGTRGKKLIEIGYAEEVQKPKK